MVAAPDHAGGARSARTGGVPAEADGGAPVGAPAVVWVHGDCLNPGGPALVSYPGPPAL